MAKIIDGEKAYPIYYIGIKYVKSGEQDPLTPDSYLGLPKGSTHGEIGFSMMFKKKLNPQEANNFFNEYWEKFVKANADKNPISPVFTLKFKRFDTWNGLWFTHETFDTGQTDAEVLNSFEKYVARVMDHNHRAEHSSDLQEIALMGAEDRWRWKGDPTIENSTAPCRCDNCKKAGMIRISH